MYISIYYIYMPMPMPRCPRANTHMRSAVINQKSLPTFWGAQFSRILSEWSPVCIVAAQ